MKPHRSLFAAVFLLVAFFIVPTQWSGGFSRAAELRADAIALPKYVFLFVADGAGITHMEITRQYNRVVHNEGLVIVDQIMKQGTLGLLTTDPVGSLSTDSAAAATALASGCKAKLSAIGICGDGSVPKTAMEIAKENGMRLGLVTNAAVYDATPAAFVNHVPSRRDYAAILNRYLELEPDVLFGGGKEQFLPQGVPGSRRKDETDLIAAFVNKGYLHVSNKGELEEAQRVKALGLFSLGDMSFEIDRDKQTEPSVYDMTQAAIRLLEDGNSNGFILFVESENVDTASHQTDLASMIRDYREFDRAVGLAYEFYKKYPRETLILVTSDHETGGLGFILALKDLSNTKGPNQVAATFDDLKKLDSIPISLKKAAAILGPNPTSEAIDALMKEYFKGFTLAPDYKEAIIKRQPISRSIFLDPTINALGMMIANHTQAYWLTTTHTNQPVFVAALGAGAEKFRGYLDNADFGKNLRALLEGKKAH
ncbi:MAG TPA: alkaline phosphatase [Candidatus Binatia bacterium]|nr:alkaline phosphatase [Candidatus Binatia bacterium]